MAEPGRSPDHPIDDTAGWVGSQIAEYVATDGARPVFTRNAPLALLTTQGGVSGLWRRTCLSYGRDGDSYLIVPSVGGGPENPGWYGNLVADPEVRLQVGRAAP
ncbi:nitroreductase/quinone reductase family protein [Compostimonas suwonensis]|uniref:Deazaflavin-dependent oxidoreductase (Nitroreductase family) n=1 Tax=Compostimonas suwonensis TaxID=1048394 RepID=A0A2M9BZM7_9MICO|nr:nitroreductase/quinone reductase family protein [Compostimonas suwonensis]PJJ63539.1 deazaflavin-dependent oxidoreductase (nitroreductase family) [Compostimonas suwonensis]